MSTLVNTTHHVAPPLVPRTSPGLERFLAARTAHPLMSALGGPVNVVEPAVAARNAADFVRTLDRHGLQSRVFYAHKANRSPAFVRELAATPADIDVASLAELQSALSNGFAPHRVQVTGPKSDELLWLAARTGVTVNLDSLAEARRLHQLIERGSLDPVTVLWRLSDFTDAPTRTTLGKKSRFGEAIASWPQIAAGLAELPLLRTKGVSFHLDTVSLEEKATAICSCIVALDELQAHGVDAHIVDIGGGFGASYVAERAEWDAWTTALAESVLGHRPPITWQRTGYGYRQGDGVLQGALSLYPAYRERVGANYLDDLLASPTPWGCSIAAALQDRLVEVWVEPGRALLEDAGWVLARVEDVREKSGTLMVHVGVNARDVSTEEHGVLVDPLLVSLDPRESDGPVSALLLGNLCLEADLLTRRLVHLPRRPQPGDLLVFVNTAGYFMDFSADQALQQPLATTVAYTPDRSHPWCLDTSYWPAPIQGIPR